MGYITSEQGCYIPQGRINTQLHDLPARPPPKHQLSPPPPSHPPPPPPPPKRSPHSLSAPPSKLTPTPQDLTLRPPLPPHNHPHPRHPRLRPNRLLRPRALFTHAPRLLPASWAAATTTTAESIAMAGSMEIKYVPTHTVATHAACSAMRD